MKLKQTTINELGVILKEEYGIRLGPKALREFAYFLVSFFRIMLKFENPPDRSIDKANGKEDDKEVDKYEN